MGRVATVFVVAAVLAACGGGGGGGDSAPPAGTAEGMWTGTTSTHRSFTGFVLDDGTYYIFYSAANLPAVSAGFVQGNSSSSGGAFSSVNARDFNFEGLGVLTATISGNYIARQSLSGTISYASAPSTFSAGFNPAYDAIPSIATIAATYTTALSAATPDPTNSVDFPSLTISSSGSVSGSYSSGCTFSGSATPRARGNAYDVTVTFSSASCMFPGQTFSGLAYFDPAKHSLFTALTDPARAAGMLLLATK